MWTWRTGLTRLYLALWWCWVLFILAVGPAYVSLQASERARVVEVEYRAHVTAGNASAATDALRRLREHRRTTLASLYLDMAHNWPDVLVALIAFPIAMYGVLLALVRSLACVIPSCRSRVGGNSRAASPAPKAIRQLPVQSRTTRDSASQPP